MSQTICSILVERVQRAVLYAFGNIRTNFSQHIEIHLPIALMGVIALLALILDTDISKKIIKRKILGLHIFSIRLSRERNTGRFVLGFTRSNRDIRRAGFYASVVFWGHPVLPGAKCEAIPALEEGMQRGSRAVCIG